MLSKRTNDDDDDEANQETQLIAAPMPPTSEFSCSCCMHRRASPARALMAAKSLSFPLEIEKALTHPSVAVAVAVGLAPSHHARGDAGWMAHPVS